MVLRILTIIIFNIICFICFTMMILLMKLSNLTASSFHKDFAPVLDDDAMIVIATR